MGVAPSIRTDDCFANPQRLVQTTQAMAITRAAMVCQTKSPFSLVTQERLKDQCSGEWRMGILSNSRWRIAGVACDTFRHRGRNAPGQERPGSSRAYIDDGVPDSTTIEDSGGANRLPSKQAMLRLARMHGPAGPRSRHHQDC